MHLSTRGRYAIMAMLDLAVLGMGSSRPVTLAMIAERQQISLSYLEQLFAKLRKAGVVDSVRGPGGGYKVSRSLDKVWLSDIVSAVDEVIDVTRCGSFDSPDGPVEGTGCMNGERCNAHHLWGALGRHIEGFMKRISLQMVLDGQLGDELPHAAHGSPVRVEIRN